MNVEIESKRDTEQQQKSGGVWKWERISTFYHALPIHVTENKDSHEYSAKKKEEKKKFLWAL